MSEQNLEATGAQNKAPSSHQLPKKLTQQAERLRPLLAIITVILTIDLFKAASAVILPVIFAIFLIALFWPLLKRLQRIMPRALAMTITFLVLLLILGLFTGAFWYSGSRISEKSAQYTETFDTYANALAEYGVDIPGFGGDSNGQTLSALLTSFQGTGIQLFNLLASAAGAFTLTIAYLMLGLLEVPAFRTKIQRIIPGNEEDRWLETTAEVAHDFQSYIVIRTGIGLLNGMLAGLALWWIGVDFPFTWGLLTFLLNYIPTIGSLFATIPPPLFALLQFGDVWTALLTLVVLGAIQLILGLYVDPLVQGRYLSPSPLVVLISVTFWGWIWGGTGAFIAVPLTILIILACRQYERTRWIAVLLADVDDDQALQEKQRQKKKDAQHSMEAKPGT